MSVDREPRTLTVRERGKSSARGKEEEVLADAPSLTVWGQTRDQKLDRQGEGYLLRPLSDGLDSEVRYCVVQGLWPACF